MSARSRRAQRVRRALQRQPLGRDVEELQAPVREVARRRATARPRRGLRVQRAGRDARGRSAAHLVAHQRDERRDDDGEARPAQRRQLVAERLAAARGHQGEARAAGGHVRHDLRLPGRKSGKPKTSCRTRRAGRPLMPPRPAMRQAQGRTRISARRLGRAGCRAAAPRPPAEGCDRRPRRAPPARGSRPGRGSAEVDHARRPAAASPSRGSEGQRGGEEKAAQGRPEVGRRVSCWPGATPGGWFAGS